MASKKGRPQKNNNNIIINDLNVEYLSTKVDKFDNSIVCFKLIDPKNKLKAVIDTQLTDKDIKISCIWSTDTQDVILKIKEKWINTITDDLQVYTNYIITADFTYYAMDSDNGPIKGYYIKVKNLKEILDHVKKSEEILGHLRQYQEILISLRKL